MKKLKGTNFDIIPLNCPLSLQENIKGRKLNKSGGWSMPFNQKKCKCAVKDVSICKSFFELKDENTILCCFPRNNHIIRFILFKLGFKKYILKHAQERKASYCDADLIPKKNLKWKQEKCPWNEAENVNLHKCVFSDKSACKYFCGIEYIDTMLCNYPSAITNQK